MKNFVKNCLSVYLRLIKYHVHNIKTKDLMHKSPCGKKTNCDAIKQNKSEVMHITFEVFYTVLVIFYTTFGGESYDIE